MRRTMPLAGIVLAAGASSRMGRPKALLELGGETFLERVVRVAQSAGLDPVRIIVGDHGAVVGERLPRLAPLLRHNPRPEEGQASSLRVGLASLERSSVAGAVVFLVDHPLVRESTVVALRDEFVRGGASIVLPVTAERRGHPTLFSREVFGELMEAPVDVGARAVVNADGRRVREVIVDDPGIHVDVDTPEELARLRRSST